MGRLFRNHGKCDDSLNQLLLCSGTKLKALADASQNYYAILAENRKLHNEVQELKGATSLIYIARSFRLSSDKIYILTNAFSLIGNIRVYCRIRPFLPGQKEKQSIIDSLNEYGDLTIANPSKQGKDGQRSFKFNKVYGPEAAQGFFSSPRIFFMLFKTKQYNQQWNQDLTFGAA